MKIAVVFPGIGYHVDKPLLYYSKKIAAECGYTIRDVPYGGFGSDIRGKPDRMMEAFQNALRQSTEILRDVDFNRYEKILFLSKSVGTAVAAVYTEQHGLRTGNVYYTPVELSLAVMKEPGIVFHGTADPWLDDAIFLRGIGDHPYYLIDHGNHSLETGNALKDLENLHWIMRLTSEYIQNF